ncbi:MAG TPA: SpoIIE family protein phosphatase [Steroidobacteraceae bacterium]|nr:SpoIIE family protein phosphatase [Steroidobacteraceae bacterium]
MLQQWGSFRTVRGRLLFWTLAVTVPIYAGALYMSYQESARGLEAGAERDVDELAARLAAGLDAVIRPIEGGVRTVAGQLEEIDPPREQYEARIRGILASWPEVYGSTIATEVDEANKARPFAPYLFWRDGVIARSDLATDDYGYRKLPWYRRAADGRQPVWSLPYFDTGGGEAWMVTYSVPFFRKLGERRVLGGVVTADLDLNWMTGVAAKVSPGPIGMGWLVSPAGTHAFVSAIGPTQSRLREFDASLQPDRLRGIAEDMLATHKTFMRLPEGTTAHAAYLAVRNLDTLNWRLMLVIPRAQLLAEARNLLNRQLLLGIAGLVLLIVAISVVAAGISRPLHALAEAVGKSSEEDPDFQLHEVPRRDEIGVLAQALRRMRDSLRKHIELRVQTMADQARAEHELQIAASIQQSMLPRTDSRVLAATVAAALVPARQVGGDLYDYYNAPDGNLLFAIGDVSDKGVPAALLMARLSTLLRTLGASGDAPDRLLFGINARLAEGNEACMFVTLGCGQLNARTGQVRYASAGHEPPLLRQHDGTVRVLATENGPALGIDTGVDYRLTEGFMAPGDTLVLYTDGVTEAAAADGSLFGIDRLTALLGASASGEPASLVQQILDTVNASGSSFHTADDLTVLAISLNPPDVTVHRESEATRWRIVPERSFAGVRQVQQWLRAILASREFAADVIGDVELIAEELLTNILRANEGREVKVAVDCGIVRGNILLTAIDDGLPFNPLARESPRLDADIADRETGGLGIEIVRQLADRCHYAHIDGRNHLDVFFQRSSPQ